MPFVYVYFMPYVYVYIIYIIYIMFKSVLSGLLFFKYFFFYKFSLKKFFLFGFILRERKK